MKTQNRVKLNTHYTILIMIHHSDKLPQYRFQDTGLSEYFQDVKKTIE